MPTQIRALCFDLFDTLIGIDETKYSKSRDRIANILGVTAHDFNAAWASTRKLAIKGEYLSLQERCAAVAKSLNLSPELADKLASLETDALSQGIHLIPNCEPFLDRIRRMGLLTGIISNASCSGPVVMEITGLKKYFDEIIFSFLEKLWKPDPRIYLLACDRLGVEPEKTVYISDGDRGELEGAHSAGLRAIRFDPMGLYQKTPLAPGILNFLTTQDLLLELKKL
jgi:putative hydrolase of the HAD superfamily